MYPDWLGCEPYRILDFQGDGGYPSSVQLPDGRGLSARRACRFVEVMFPLPQASRARDDDSTAPKERLYA